jgi:hypothetical protein
MTVKQLTGYDACPVIIALIVGILVVLSFGALPGCASAPVMPQTVTVVVEKFKPMPTWATATQAKPMLADGTVASHLRREDALDASFDYNACLRRLLASLDADKPVSASVCDKPPQP